MKVAEQGTLTASRRRLPLYALYTANAISASGDVLTFLAVPWFVLQTTGSVAQTGITAFFSTASIAVSALFGGALVDRLGFRRMSVLSDVLSGVGVALIPLLYHTVGLPFWTLLALVFLAGLLTTPGATARSALVPDLAQLGQVRLERASAATDGVNRISRFIGAPLAGVLIGTIGTSNLLWVDATSFFISAAIIGAVVPVHTRPSSTHSTHSTHSAPPEEALEEPHTAGGMAALRRYLSGLREGIGFLWRDHLLFSLIATVMVTNLLDAGFASVLLPASIKQTFGSAVILGGMVAAFGGAAFVGTVVFGAIGHRLPRQLTLGIGFTLGGASRFWVLVFAPIPWVLLVVSAVAGFCIGPVNPLLSTVEYERVPSALRARIFGTITAGAMVGMPLGGLLSAACASWIGLQGSILLFGACYFVATMSLLVNPAVRAMNAVEKPQVGSVAES